MRAGVHIRLTAQTVTLTFAFAACSLIVDATDLTAAQNESDAAADGPNSTDDSATDSPTGDGGPGDGGPNDGMIADAPGDTPLVPGCKGNAGPTPIVIPGAGFCMDQTEVTVGQYRTSLAARGGDTSGQPPECAWNTSFIPQFGMPPPEKDDDAINWIDWCDALAYCTWAGKTLCGGADGAPIAIAESNQATISRWFRVCSNNNDGLHDFPYGSVYDGHACVGLDFFDGGTGGVQAPGTAPACVSAPAPIFDLSGNVREWDNACDPIDANADAAARNCLVRGGAYYDIQGALECGAATSVPVSERNVGFGIRCCSATQ